MTFVKSVWCSSVCLNLVIVVATLAIPPVATAQDIDGVWKFTSRGQSVYVMVRQDGDSVDAEYLTIFSKAGWEPGDWVLRGNFDGRTMRGMLHLRFGIEYREEVEKWCPGAWDHEGEFEMTLSPDGNSMSGKWANASINLETDCSPIDYGWETMQFTRELPQKVEIVAPDRPYEDLAEIPIGESLRVRVIFKNKPYSVDCPSVTVRNTTNGKDTIIPTTRDKLSTDQPNKIICITEPVKVVPAIQP